ncbi:MAG TPA: prepilin-type N-terminal cleavage/methylation domain-containing protein [Candidatus Saccharimonadales bacterium]|nr:prepilin-type N-terminal cleavage/methylation domain-containing protein [Candidatus Saccharimonadales bacterium]
MNRQKGFTIIEVLMFVAVSALLLAGVMAGISTNLNNTRFLSSTKSLENYLQKQFDDVQAGVFQRSAGATCTVGSGTPEPPGASDDCVVIGKVVRFTDKYMLVFSVMATTDSYPPSCVDSTDSDPLRIACYKPTTISSQNGKVDVAHYDYQWGATIASGSKLQLNGSDADANTLAILRSPATGNMYTFSFNLPGYTLSQPTQGRALYNGDISQQNLNRPSVLCLKAESLVPRQSYIYVTGGLGADAVRSGDNMHDLPGGLSC